MRIDRAGTSSAAADHDLGDRLLRIPRHDEADASWPSPPHAGGRVIQIAKAQHLLVALLLPVAVLGCEPPVLPVSQPAPPATMTPPLSGTPAGIVGMLAVSDGIDGVFLFDLASGELIKLTNTDFPAFDADWSPDGTMLVFRAELGGNSEIFVIDADGSNLRNITGDPATDFAPAWSPDGSLIAFASDRSPTAGVADIFVMRPDGSHVRHVAGHAAVDEYPDWYPDGQQIVFSGGDVRGADQDIYIVRLDSSDERNLTNSRDAHENEPAWSPDGATIVFTCGKGTCAGEPSSEGDVLAISPDGTALRNLTSSPEDEGSLAWSPDGEWISLLRYPGGLFVMAPDGSDARRIEIPLGEPDFASWRPIQP